MSADEDSQVPENAPSFFVDQIIVASTQLSQQSRPSLVPDSYADVSRVPLPQLPLASVPTGTRAVYDRLKPMYEATFPNVHRFFNAKSRAEAAVSWEWCSPEEIWSIVTCKFLASGAQKTMAWYQNEALKYVRDLLTRFVAAANDQLISQKVRARVFIA